MLCRVRRNLTESAPLEGRLLDIPQLTDYSEVAIDAAFAHVRHDAEAAVAAPDLDVEAFRLEWLGRKQGRLKAISDAWLKSAPAEAKRPIGQRFNTLKEQVEALLAGAAAAPTGRRQPMSATLDLSLPGTAQKVGAEHPLISTMAEDRRRL